MPPKRKTEFDPLYVFDRRITTLEQAYQQLRSNKILTVPGYDPTNFPTEAVEGQIAVGTDDSLWWFSNGAWHNTTTIIGLWVTVGTPGVDGVDSFIADNPSPFNVTPWVPFLNSWTHRLNTGDFPLQFKLSADNFVYTRGVAVNSSAVTNSDVFQYPVPYRVVGGDQPMVERSTNANKVAAITSQSDGYYVYEGEF